MLWKQVSTAGVALFLAAMDFAAGSLRADVIEDVTGAETNILKVDANGFPLEARTTFFEPTWSSNKDRDVTSEHELLHAIGFASIQKFNAHVQAPDPTTGDRKFTQNADGTGTLLAILGPAANGTHVDPKAGIVNGFNQADSLMVPSPAVFTRMGTFEKSILDAAFDWSHNTVTIKPVFETPFNQPQKDSINFAISDYYSLFKNNGNQHTFIWDVRVVETPEPGSAILYVCCATLLLASKSLSWARTRSAQVVLPLVAVGLIATIATQADARAPDRGHEDLSGSPNTDVIRLLDSREGGRRKAATAELFRRGDACLRDLEKAGARPAVGLTPPRIDVIYSLIRRLEPEQRFVHDTLGLRLEPGVNREQVIRMGNRHGFEFPEGERIDYAGFPTCYVRLKPGKDLAAVMKSILSEESAVITVNRLTIED